MRRPSNPLINHLAGGDAKGKASTPAERARAADLLHFPKEMKGGTCCANCMYIKKGYCHQEEVDQPIADPAHECCAYWDTPGTVRVGDEGRSNHAT